MTDGGCSGWIDHNGGPCPITDHGVSIYVMTRTGIPGWASALNKMWEHGPEPRGVDIVAYRKPENEK